MPEVAFGRESSAGGCATPLVVCPVPILADEISRQVRAGLSGGVAALYPQVA